jgi:hypothetical protein
MSNFKPVLNQNDTPYYVSQSEFIKFISENSDMKWNRICDVLIDNEGIIYPDED